MFTLKNSKTIYTVNTSDYDFANLMKPNDKVSFKANIVEKKSIRNVANFKDDNLRYRKMILAVELGSFLV